MIDTILTSIFIILITLAPIPSTAASIYLQRLSKEQGGKSWLLKMLSRGSWIATISGYVISFFVVYGIFVRLGYADPLTPGLGSLFVGSALLAIMGVNVYFGLIIRERRKIAEEHFTNGTGKERQ